VKKINAVLLIIGLLVTTGASAVATIGSVSCGEWVKNREAKNRIMPSNLAYLAGYLSGIAVGTGNEFLRNANAESLWSWMDNYCKANPLNNVDNGAISLSNELIQRSSPK
jgi:hypothetical protein